jgi:hypothetical protein
VPFRGGYQPQSIAVFPIEGEELPELLRDELDSRAHAVLQRRGYEVVPAAVTRKFLASLGATTIQTVDAKMLQRLRSEYHVDTVLLRRGRPLPRYSSPLEGFVVQWSLVDTMTGQTIWAQEQSGGSRRRQELALRSDSPYTDDPMLSDEPMVQRSTGSWVTEVPPPTVGDIADSLQRALVARLPAYEEPE